MQEDIQFGSITRAHKLDDNGSKLQVTEHFRQRKLNELVTKEYRIRHKVHSPAEEHRIFLDFSRLVQEDKGVFKPSFEYEINKLRNPGEPYFVIERYMRLEPLLPSSDDDELVEFERKRI